MCHFDICLRPVFLLYDFVITFGREVNLFWSSKVTGASVLLIIIRYYSIVAEIVDFSKTRKVGPCNSCALHSGTDGFLEVCMLSRYGDACAHTNCYAFHYSCAVLVKVGVMMGDLVYLPIAGMSSSVFS